MNEEIVKDLVRIRLSQMMVNEKYKEGKFKIPIHLSFGHEAIAIALSHSLKGEDKVLLTHRNIAYNLARAPKLKPIMDEYLLLDSGLCQGRLGSMNLINRERNIIYSSSILANNFSVAAGVAMAEKLKINPSATFVLGGDGSMEEGSFYESLVMMKSLDLSVVVIIENNEWSLGSHITERRIPIDLRRLVSSVDIEFIQLEGNDAFSYLKTLTEIRQKSLNENKIYCVEVKLKTLGDRNESPSSEYPSGKYINYHAGPSSTVNLSGDIKDLFLRYDIDDPIYVLKEQIGENAVLKVAEQIYSNLKSEFK